MADKTWRELSLEATRLGRLITNLPGKWNRNYCDEHQAAAEAIAAWMDTLTPGTCLLVGSVTDSVEDPWHLRKMEDGTWTGFFYDYGIRPIAMADRLIHHLTAIHSDARLRGTLADGIRIER